MSFKIEKSVPTPVSEGRGRPMKYPWPDMAVGDSILFPTDRGYRAAFSYGKRHGKKFVMRTEGGKVRVWRTA